MRHVTDSSGRTYCMDCAWVIYRTLYREEPAEAPAPVVRPARAVRLRE